jgi:hypothetical protein
MTTNKPEFTVSSDVAEHLMKKSNGKFFSATFIKRTDGTERTMVGRLKVTPKNPSLSGRVYQDSDHGLLTVYVPKVSNYRTIPLDSVLEIGTLGAKFKVDRG